MRVHSLSIEYLEQSLTALVHYPDKNAEAQAYIYMAETFSSEGHNVKAYLFFTYSSTFFFYIRLLFYCLHCFIDKNRYELLRGAQGIAQETINATHLNLCKERIPKEFKKKEKNKKKKLSERYASRLNSKGVMY